MYAQLIDSIGAQKVVEMAQRLGVKSELRPHASIALGTADVSVLEMAGVYQTFQTKGMQIEPRVIRRIVQNDSVLVDDRPKATRVLEKAVAEKVNYALQQVVDEGSGVGAALPQAQVWGKTGTTDGYGDAWFVGYTRQLTTAVWMGYPEGQAKPLHNVQGVSRVSGGSLPADIFKRFMSKANPPDPTPPDTVPDLTGRTVAPVASIGSSRSSSSSGSSSGSESSDTTTTVAEVEEDEEESPTTTARPTTATTVPEPVSVPATAPPLFTPPTSTATTARPRPTVTFTIPDRP